MSSAYLVPPRPAVSIGVQGAVVRFPVNRIYCVGRNYAAHAREMGFDPDREPPFFFLKPADAVVENGADIPYPTETTDLHHEVELVVALGRGGRTIPVESALAHVAGYAVGVDLTRRDLQIAAREKGRPWDAGKAFDASAPISPIALASEGAAIASNRIWLSVNGEIRQDADLSKLIWGVAEIIATLSRLFELHAGDLIFTGTPEGVGPLRRGDVFRAGIDGIGTIEHRIV